MVHEAGWVQTSVNEGTLDCNTRSQRYALVRKPTGCTVWYQSRSACSVGAAVSVYQSRALRRVDKELRVSHGPSQGFLQLDSKTKAAALIICICLKGVFWFWSSEWIAALPSLRKTTAFFKICFVVSWKVLISWTRNVSFQSSSLCFC